MKTIRKSAILCAALAFVITNNSALAAKNNAKILKTCKKAHPEKTEKFKTCVFNKALSAYQLATIAKLPNLIEILSPYKQDIKTFAELERDKKDYYLVLAKECPDTRAKRALLKKLIENSIAYRKRLSDNYNFVAKDYVKETESFISYSAKAGEEAKAKITIEVTEDEMKKIQSIIQNIDAFLNDLYLTKVQERCGVAVTPSLDLQKCRYQFEYINGQYVWQCYCGNALAPNSKWSQYCGVIPAVTIPSGPALLPPIQPPVTIVPPVTLLPPVVVLPPVPGYNNCQYTLGTRNGIRRWRCYCNGSIMPRRTWWQSCGYVPGILLQPPAWTNCRYVLQWSGNSWNWQCNCGNIAVAPNRWGAFCGLIPSFVPSVTAFPPPTYVPPVVYNPPVFTNCRYRWGRLGDVRRWRCYCDGKLISRSIWGQYCGTAPTYIPQTTLTPRIRPPVYLPPIYIPPPYVPPVYRPPHWRPPHIHPRPPHWRPPHIHPRPPHWRPPHVRKRPPHWRPPHVRKRPPHWRPPHVSPRPPHWRPPHVRKRPPHWRPPHVRKRPPHWRPPHVRPRPPHWRPRHERPRSPHWRPRHERPRSPHWKPRHRGHPRAHPPRMRPPHVRPRSPHWKPRHRAHPRAHPPRMRPSHVRPRSPRFRPRHRSHPRAHPRFRRSPQMRPRGGHHRSPNRRIHRKHFR